MQTLKRYVRLIGQGIFLGLLSGILFLAAQSIFSNEGFAQKSYKQFEFKNAVQSAFSYRKRNDDYQGVCFDISYPAHVTCVETANTFKLEMERSEGGFYCADSTGFNGVQNESSSASACVQ